MICLFDVKTISSLERVFLDVPYEGGELTSASMLKNDIYSFQFIYKVKDEFDISNTIVDIVASHDLGQILSLRYVDYVPCDFPIYENAKGPIERKMPGLFPDILKPLPKKLWAYKGHYRSLWVTIDGHKGDLKAGKHEISLSLIHGQERLTRTFILEVLDKSLMPYELKCTHWFHTDCLCDYYNIDFDTDEYWQVTEDFAKMARSYGVNMVLTPLFTPPLDTEVGGQRRTIQLVDVYKDNDKYSFNFDKLRRWVDMCKRIGIEYYEMSHLFTQWGCKHAPKICAYEKGEYKRIFGWETDASGPEYRSFLSQFLPELVKELKDLGIDKLSYFHVSDEPNLTMLEDYRKSSSFIKEYLEGFNMFDALSSIEFYKEGLINCPIPSLDHLGSFLEEDIEELWTYYCCGQHSVSNRFLAFPSSRNRLLGLILFKYNIAGFLQWGLNFYNSHHSLYAINPYSSSTGGGWVPGGDTFVLYPGHDRQPIASLRFEVFREGLQDQRALNTLAKKIGKDQVLELIKKNLSRGDFDYNTTDISAKELINLREVINREL